MATEVKQFDRPAEVLYWTLTQGQRHKLIERLGLLDDLDRMIYPDDINRSQAWLQRARERGSFEQLILTAEATHRSELRHLQDAIKLNGVNGTLTRDDELLAYVERHYQWLSYGSVIAAADRRQRAFDRANERHPLPLSGTG
jgi:hypothetical protein